MAQMIFFKEKLQYMHINSLRRGLLLHGRDWSWSSRVRYARTEKSLARIDSLKHRVEQTQKKSQNPHP
jgi:hypothetical protein